MNRVKLWVYVVLAVGSGTLFLRTSSLDATARARAGIDRRVKVASVTATEALKVLDGQAAAVAALVARDASVEEALRAAAEPLTTPRGPRTLATPLPDEATREQARLEVARAAARAAAATAGVPSDARLEVWVAARADFDDGAQADPVIWDLLREAAAGKPSAAHLVLGEVAWTVAASPAGNGGAVAVALALDAAWAGRVAELTGVDVTLAIPGAKPVSTAAPGATKAIADAAVRAPRALVDVGRLEPVPFALPIPVPPATLPFGDAPAHRAFALPVEGLKGGAIILSAATRADLAPLVREAWTGLAGLVAFLVIGFLFGFLVGGEARPRVEKRKAKAEKAAPPAPPAETGAQAFPLPPRAEPALEPLPPALEPLPAAPPPEPASPGDPFASAPPFAEPLPAPSAPEPLPPTGGFDAPPAAQGFAEPLPPATGFGAPPAAPAFEEPLPPAPPRADAGGLFGGTFEAAPLRAPPASEPAFASATPADLLQASAQTAAPELAEDPDEGHWRQVFDEFLRVRRECGEAAEGLAYEKFRAKLEKNRDQLVAKYACKTVRFHVYVKEGKAALKATPVR